MKSASSTRLVMVLIAAAGAAGLLFALRPGASPSQPETEPITEVKPVEQPVVAKVDPPKTEEVGKPAETTPADSDAMKAALLGLNKPNKAGGIQEMAERARERAAVAANTRPRRTMTSEADEPPLDDPPTIGLSDATFHDVLGRWRGVQTCLTSTGREDASADKKGALRISLKINREGEVLDSRVFEPTNEIARLIAPCVERSAKQLRFPAFTGDDSSVTRTAKFVF